MDIKNLYGYTVDSLAIGIVVATSIEAARKKSRQLIKCIMIAMMNKEMIFLFGK